ncbi:MAG: ABC transporter permease subunit [Bacillota bacterium]|nr:ABC transporter permease [Bacillota bacterium]HOB90723.1 ABC transporter permease [Bacillota bacterium]HPZ54096.1 ABC transporter permease [Bacillota bacterium]HQD18154.1 ABC transporter permease [Bacillota bacterium]
MRRLLAIYKREVGAYFLSPTAYVVAAVFLSLTGYFFTAITTSLGLAEMRLVFPDMATIFLFVAPILTMRTIAEEKKAGTDELLFTAPVSIATIVVGKYLAVLTVYCVMLLLTFTYPGVLIKLANPDIGPIASGYLGLFLIGAVFLAVGVFASSLTNSQVVAGVITFGILLFTYVVSWASNVLSGLAGRVLSVFSVLDRMSDLQKGVINTSDILYYISIAFVFLFLAVRMLDSRRWS